MMLKNFRLLLVEDNIINQMLLRELLEQEGATVDIAANGIEALAQIQNPGKTYDAVLMDLQMPQMGGIEATRRIRAYPGMADLPILAMTAHSRDEDREQCLTAGMNDYCLKPIDVPELMDKLTYWKNRQTSTPVAVAEQVLPDAHGSESIDFGELKTLIDIEDGLSRCRGVASRYADLLKLFLVNYRDFPSRAISLYEMGEWVPLGKAVHSLRGVAGNLGAKKLFETARVFQFAIENPDIQVRLTAFENFLDSTRELLATLFHWEVGQPIETMARFASEISVANPDNAPVALDVLLSRLTDCLASNNLEADSLWLRISNRLPG